MLKELVQLIAAASETVGNGCKVEHLQDCIDHAIEAVGKHDAEKRKTDEAICLLFQAGTEGTEWEDRQALLARAEKLLGFAQLTKEDHK